MNRRVAQRQALLDTPPRNATRQQSIPESPMEDGVPMTQERIRELQEEEEALRQYRERLHRELTMMEENRSRMEENRNELQRMREAGEDLTRRVNDPLDAYLRFKILFDENINDINSLGNDYSTFDESIEKINLLRGFLHNNFHLRFTETQGEFFYDKLELSVYNRREIMYLRRDIDRRTDYE